MKKEKSQEYIFPKNFYWGAATASHQVEGNNYNDWSEWEKSEKRINDLKKSGLLDKYGQDNFISGRGADHYNKYKEDFKLAKELGHNATRFSIEWSRIEPEEGKFDQKAINHYKDVIKRLKELDIEPFVTLWHWPIPIWLRDKGGLKSSEMPKYFVRYAKKVVEALGDDVKFWITLNEPLVNTSISYIQGIWPPQRKNPFVFLKVNLNLLKSHKLTYTAIKEINPKAQVGIAKHNAYFSIKGNYLINKGIKSLVDALWNHLWLRCIRDHQDFIGLNHYFHHRILYGLGKNERKIINHMGWEIYPTSLYHCLKDLKRYNKPIYVTENGLADAKDEKRTWFIYEMLKGVHKAIEEGVDVKGYLHWSLMDNFEWADGYWPRFGLIEIDYDTLERRPRKSAYFYRDICKSNGITSSVVEKYKEEIERFS
ncbi:MAG: glycoside hydrolase family 1 protein [Candidatus Dojkabacteria bacterium]